MYRRTQCLSIIRHGNVAIEGCNATNKMGYGIQFKKFVFEFPEYSYVYFASMSNTPCIGQPRRYTHIWSQCVILEGESVNCYSNLASHMTSTSGSCCWLQYFNVICLLLPINVHSWVKVELKINFEFLYVFPSFHALWQYTHSTRIKWHKSTGCCTVVWMPHFKMCQSVTSVRKSLFKIKTFVYTTMLSVRFNRFVLLSGVLSLCLVRSGIGV